ncbi:hemolysin family protein [Spirochaeta isovalerica]|uniref:CBS domain containing-hemolysin-like protein n=1 Tax=Spirochaeta isovalerica TaxID=150 RepID=A0A841RE98_9SPIO|nr:hemolysin family protein [Spirochaeta isovalerica]MBB6482395.1 CBS domain containing-hemolysin-like protein [Spirochaeta isovalerica]
MTIDLVLLTVFLMLSGFFSSTETAFTSLSLIQAHKLVDEHGKKGERVQKLSHNPDILLTTLLIGNNLVNIGATTLATKLTINLFGSHALGYMTGALTLFILIFGEVTPKQIAMAKNTSICLHTAPVVWFLSWIFRPFIWIITLISSTITRIFVSSTQKTLTLENLLLMVSMGENMGIVETYENQMVKNVFRINDTPIQGIVTHRKDVYSLSGDLFLSEAIDDMLRSGFSRIPIFKENPENIVGIVLVKELIKIDRETMEDLRLRDMMLEPLYIPHSKKVNEVFTLFKQKAINIAIVLDEYGGLAGIVTREDVIEEIFGELYDENEIKETDKIISEGKNSWIIAGDTSFYTIHDKLDIELEHSRRILTISGYIIEKIGHIPEEGEVLDFEEGTYEILKVRNNRIQSVRFRIIPEE